MDGRIIQHPGVLPDRITAPGGEYATVRVSPNVVVYDWTPEQPKVDRWARRRKPADWGVHKTAFGR